MQHERICIYLLHQLYVHFQYGFPKNIHHNDYTRILRNQSSRWSNLQLWTLQKIQGVLGGFWSTRNIFHQTLWSEGFPFLAGKSPRLRWVLSPKQIQTRPLHCSVRSPNLQQILQLLLHGRPWLSFIPRNGPRLTLAALQRWRRGFGRSWGIRYRRSRCCLGGQRKRKREYKC